MSASESKRRQDRMRRGWKFGLRPAFSTRAKSRPVAPLPARMTLPLRAQPTPDEARRVEWIDVAKGVAIFLVVVGHITGGLLSQNALQPAARWQAIYDWIYLFHMPVFLFLAGWLVRQRRSGPAARSIARYTATLLYPYFLWGILTWLFHLGGDSLGATNHPTSLWVPLELIYNPQAGPWFLHILFLLHVLWLFGERSKVARGVLFGLALAVQVFDYSRGGPIIFTLCRTAIYYALGFELAGILAARPWNLPRPAALAAALACFGAMTALFIFQPAAPALRLLLPGCLGTVGTLLLARAFEGFAWMAPVEWAGRHSLAIYVLHAFAPPFVRWIFVSRLHVTDGVPILAAGVVAAFASVVVVVWAEQRFGLTWLFRWPTRRPSPAAPLPVY